MVVGWWWWWLGGVTREILQKSSSDVMIMQQAGRSHTRLLVLLIVDTHTWRRRRWGREGVDQTSREWRETGSTACSCLRPCCIVCVCVCVCLCVYVSARAPQEHREADDEVEAVEHRPAPDSRGTCVCGCVCVVGRLTRRRTWRRRPYTCSTGTGA